MSEIRPAAALSIAAVAQELSVSERTIIRLIDAKRIHAVKIGRTVRIARTELDRLLSEGTGGAA